MSEPLYYEDLTVGDCWTSLGRTVTETDVVNFAGMTGDYDPLHVDHEFARETPFGKPIAHGLLGLSLVAGLSSHFPAVRTVAFLTIEKWEFLKPIYIGDTVHAETQVLDKQLNGRRTGHITWQRRLVNQSGDVLQTGNFRTLVSVARVQRKRQDLSKSESEPTLSALPSKRAAG